jgi:predicted acylesterase/phospholipase RssA
MALETEPRPPFECTALVLQGGGALGACQAGVHEALAAANIHPDWIAGISIGAINGALIAGNARCTPLPASADVLPQYFLHEGGATDHRNMWDE